MILIAIFFLGFFSWLSWVFSSGFGLVWYLWLKFANFESRFSIFHIALLRVALNALGQSCARTLGPYRYCYWC